MAKDPAVLFYTADFISGTITMTDEQRGQYILLLCIQHQKGHLTEKDMLKICSGHDEEVFSKFTLEDGKYYNKRMKVEADKRAAYAESRRQNRKKKETPTEDMIDISKTYDTHMENENENINKDINEVKILEKKNWKNDFDTYIEEMRTARKELFENTEWLEKQQSFNPGVDIKKSIDKSCVNYWATEAGWKNKKRKQIKTVDWKATFANAISSPQNRVYLPR